VRIVAIGERHTRFELAVKSAAPQGGARWQPGPEESRAGLARVDVCNGAGVSAVAVSMSSARGTVEVLSAQHRGPLASVGTVVPERAVGPVAPRAEVGSALALAPVSERMARAEEVARGEGADVAVRFQAPPGARGAAAMVLKLPEGCHRVGVFAPARQGADIDVDAEARLVGQQTPLARDRSHAPDARLDFCLGETSAVELHYAGAVPGVAAHVMAARWPLPEGLPRQWGATATAGLAWALQRRRLPALTSRPEGQWVGVPGVSYVPVPVVPGACYVAAMGVARGEAVIGRLSARVGGVLRYDDANDGPKSAAVSFCAPAESEIAKLQIELRAATAWWVLALWQVGGAPFATTEVHP
jgi:hypothetical protein